jgi:hypothetical protein
MNHFKAAEAIKNNDLIGATLNNIAIVDYYLASLMMPTMLT